MAITLDEAKHADRFEHITQKNADRTPVRAKRNGKTVTWKTRPNDFAIPVKYGLKTYFYISNVPYKGQSANADQWNLDQNDSYARLLRDEARLGRRFPI